MGSKKKHSKKNKDKSVDTKQKKKSSNRHHSIGLGLEGVGTAIAATVAQELLHSVLGRSSDHAHKASPLQRAAQGVAVGATEGAVETFGRSIRPALQELIDGLQKAIDRIAPEDDHSSANGQAVSSPEAPSEIPSEAISKEFSEVPLEGFSEQPSETAETSPPTLLNRFVNAAENSLESSVAAGSHSFYSAVDKTVGAVKSTIGSVALLDGKLGIKQKKDKKSKKLRKKHSKKIKENDLN